MHLRVSPQGEGGWLELHVSIRWIPLLQGVNWQRPVESMRTSEERKSREFTLIPRSLRSETIIFGVVGVSGAAAWGELTLAKLLYVASRRKRSAS
jgi:hypothetical protein